MKLPKRLLAPVTVTMLSLVLCSFEGSAGGKNDDDYSVPAMSDLPLIGSQSAVERSLLTNPAQVQLDFLPPVKELRSLDINQDLQLNDFDVKQFEGIIDHLNGSKLSGLQLATRFRTEQRNQHDSFPILYDLNRDGLFTEYDVDYFTRLIDELDEGKNSGNELAQKFRLRVFPPQHSKK